MKKVLFPILALVLAMGLTLPMAIPAQADPHPLEYSPDEYEAEVAQGSSISFNLSLTADVGTDVEYVPKLVGKNTQIPDNWIDILDPVSGQVLEYIVLSANSPGEVTVKISVPSDANEGEYETKIKFTPRTSPSSPEGKGCEVEIEVVPSLNQAPVLAEIGDQLVAEGSTLDVGIAATDPDGDAITLSATGLPAFTSFTDNTDGTGTLSLAPDYDDEGVYYGVEIMASDGVLSDSETITITVLGVNRVPVADAGADQTVIVGTLVALDGSGSFDLDAEPLSYAWTQTEGPAVTLSDSSVVDPTFTPTMADVYTFSLIVNDGDLSSAPDTVSITVNTYVAPPMYGVVYVPPVVVSVEVTPESATVAVGETQQFTATGTYSDGTVVDSTGEATWASSDATVANIDDEGLATGVADGASEITASLGGITSDLITLNVSAPPAQVVVVIEVTLESATVEVGQTQQFTAMATYSDGSVVDITTEATWTSSDTAVATITDTGLATVLAEGVFEIIASLGWVTSYPVSLNVIAAPVLVVVSIEITPESATIAVGETQQFTAMGTYSDGSTADITAVATWTSSDIVVATIDDAGLATGTDEGVAEITASLEGITGEPSTLTVAQAVPWGIMGGIIGGVLAAGLMFFFARRRRKRRATETPTK